jgi:hypothetical protein
MGMLAKLIKAIIGAALLNKSVRNAFMVAMIKSMSWILRPSTVSRITAFFTKRPSSAPGSSRSNFLASLFKGIAELALLGYAKRSGFSGSAALSTLAALLLATMRGREVNSGKSNKGQKDQIIDIDEYIVVD